MKKRLLSMFLSITTILVFTHAQCQKQKPAPQVGRSNLKEAIAARTLQEKAQPIEIGGYTFPATDPGAYTIPEKVTGAAGRTHAILRLGLGRQLSLLNTNI